MQRSAWRGLKLKRNYSETSVNNLNGAEKESVNEHINAPELIEASEMLKPKRSNSNPIATYTYGCRKAQNATTEDTLADLQFPTEKSTIILIAIVLLFIFTDSYRLALKMYEVVNPRGTTFESFEKCLALGR